MYLLHCDTLHVVDAVVSLVEVFGDYRVPVFLMMFERYWKNLVLSVVFVSLTYSQVWQ